MTAQEKELIELFTLRMDECIASDNDPSSAIQQGCNGAGCLYTCRGNTYILSVAHLLPSYESHSIRVNAYFDEQENRGVYYSFKKNYLKSYSIGESGIHELTTPTGSDIHELLYTRISSDMVFYNVRQDETGRIFNNAPMLSFKSIRRPRKALDDSEVYYVGGIVNYQKEIGNDRMSGDFVYYYCELCDYDEKYDRYAFEILNSEEFDVDDNKGLSGAPIFDKGGNLISIVTAGIGNSLLFGLNLDRCLLPLHLGLD